MASLDDPHLSELHRQPQMMGSLVLPVLATISALSIMAAASATIGVWRDVSVMRESLSQLVKNQEAQHKKNDEVAKELLEHEVRLAKGKL
jgi:hypothetical protein